MRHFLMALMLVVVVDMSGVSVPDQAPTSEQPSIDPGISQEQIDEWTGKESELDDKVEMPPQPGVKK